MDNLPDFEIQRTGDPEPSPESPKPGGTPGVWIAVVAALAVIAGGLYYLLPPKRLPPVKTESHPVTPKTVTEPPLGGRPEAITVPPLDRSDEVVRSLVRALSTQPAVLAWLATPNLIRNFTAAVGNIADGVTPRKLLTPLAPRRGFETVERDGVHYIDPRSYARYDTMADAVSSVDPAGAAKLYATLKPRLEEAYRDLGPADPSIDHALERAIVQLLRTPIVDRPVAVVAKGIGWAYADEHLEGLTAAQKQLLRMGPRNGRIIQERLRAVAAALGIDPNRLPAPQPPLH